VLRACAWAGEDQWVAQLQPSEQRLRGQRLLFAEFGEWQIGVSGVPSL
jgi:hypothetical protein